MLRLSLTLLYTQWVYLSSVFSIINPVSIKPTGHLTLYISADRMIPSHKIALLCDGQELLPYTQKSRRETLPNGKIPRQYSFTGSGFSLWCLFPLQKIVLHFFVREPTPASHSVPCGSQGKLLSFLSADLRTPHPIP